MRTEGSRRGKKGNQEEPKLKKMKRRKKERENKDKEGRNRKRITEERR